MRLAADVAGDGPPLVLLHGFTGSAATWAPLRAALGRRFRTIAVELPGHGRSPVAEQPEAARLDRLAGHLVAVLDRLGLARAHWLGYSLGGRAALHVAVHHPARVDRLVLEGASPGIADDGERAARAAADAALADSIERDGLEAFVDHWMAQPLFASQVRLGPATLARERAARLAGSPAGLASALRAMGVGTQAPLWARLADVASPTLVVVGAEDVRYGALADAMVAQLPAARVLRIPGAGHAPHLEQPAAFTEAVVEFLTQHGRAVTAPPREETVR